MHRPLLLAVCFVLVWRPCWAEDRLELVRCVPLWKGSVVKSPDTSGIAYNSKLQRLVIADSEVSEYGKQTDGDGNRVFAGKNIFVTDLAMATVHGRYLAEPTPGGPSEPVGITYNPVDDAYYVTDDDRHAIYRYPASAEGLFESYDATISTNPNGGYSDPEGITCDPRSGELFVVSGTKEECVLRFRYDAEAKAMEYLGTFRVDGHIHDPEGIALDPATGNLFLVSGGGIAEFTQRGEFVQFWKYDFLTPHGVRFILPGGGTFAPSSDPNDAADVQSLYVSGRGIDNGGFPAVDSLDGAVAELRLVRQRRYVSEADLAKAIRVPQDKKTIQSAIDDSEIGQVILIAPGTYREHLDLAGKSVQLVSEYVISGDEGKIAETILDGGGKSAAIGIPKSAAMVTRIVGITIQHADDGISAEVPFDILHCRLTKCADAIDYEAGGGLVRYCTFWDNGDDAIDLDGSTAATIEFCEIRDNRDDGIEIRLHPHEGAELEIVIRNNVFSRNGEDGIQLIGYEERTPRRFRIERNRFIDNRDAGIGLMDGANTREDLKGATLPEPVEVIGNTFSGGQCHITGGGNLRAVNNIFLKAEVVSLRHQADGCSVCRNLFWKNKADTDGSRAVDSMEEDPQLDEKLRPVAGSVVIDAAMEKVVDGDTERMWLMPLQYEGKRPDLGAWEFSSRAE